MSEASDDDAIWLTVESHKGIGGMYTYCGRGSRKALEQWRRGELRGALTLEHTYWVEEDEAGRRSPVVVGRHPSFRHGTGVVHLSAATIVLIMELRHPDPGVLELEGSGRVVHLGAIRDSRNE